MKFFTPIQTIISEYPGAWKNLHTNKTISLTTRGVLACIIVMLGLIGFFWQSLPPEIPIWFSRPWGVERLGASWWLLLFPIMTGFWFITNTLFSLYVTKEHLVFSQILHICSLGIAFLSAITVSMIIWIML
jgi:hypothetical protein